MNDVTIILKFATELSQNSTDKFNVELKYSAKLLDRNVKKACEEFAATYDSEISVASMQMSISAGQRLLRKFGSVKAVDKAVDEYNAEAKRPCFNIRTLADKLAPTGKKPAPKPSALQKRLSAGVEAGIITEDQAKRLLALDV